MVVAWVNSVVDGNAYAQVFDLEGRTVGPEFAIPSSKDDGQGVRSPLDPYPGSTGPRSFVWNKGGL